MCILGEGLSKKRKKNRLNGKENLRKGKGITSIGYLTVHRVSEVMKHNP